MLLGDALAPPADTLTGGNHWRPPVSKPSPSTPLDVSATCPSLRDHPCRYPDPRPPHAARPYAYRRGFAYGLRVAPRSSGHRELAAVPVEAADGAPPLGAWLRESAATPIDRRVPVLAIGSNAYPRQLRDKFQRQNEADDVVVTLGCTIPDARIAFAPTLSKAGYIPLTLRHAPGRRTHTWIQWLTAEQLSAIAKTEGDLYQLVECGDGGAVVTVHGVAARPPAVYAWVHSALLDFGEGAVGFVGNPPPEHDRDESGRSEEDVLHDAVARFLHAAGATLTWDGCTVPADRRAALGEFLAQHGAANTLPRHWTVIDRSQPDFAAKLIAP